MIIARCVRLVCVTIALTCAQAHAQQGTMQTSALLDCTLIDDNASYNDEATNRTQQQRLSMIGDALRDDIGKRGFFRVTDNAPARTLIDSLRSTQDLSACNGCELRGAKQLGASRVGVCWVQKISNLILNINLARGRYGRWPRAVPTLRRYARQYRSLVATRGEGARRYARIGSGRHALSRRIREFLPSCAVVSAAHPELN